MTGSTGPASGALPMATGGLADGAAYVTDGGLETDLIFHHGVDLPEFAAFPLLADEAGRALLADYYRGYAPIATRAGSGLLLETPTWRANPDWGSLLGYSAEALGELNRRAVGFLRDLSREVDGQVATVVVAGMIGPRGDGYQASAATAEEAADYHGPQVGSFAAADADLISALTLTSVGEAVGIAWAAAASGLPVTLAFTVETDGRLPDGTPLGAAIVEVDRQTGGSVSHFLVNCAHPRHIAEALGSPDSAWLARVGGLRVNASLLSHAELDEAAELDEGDIEALADETAELARRLPSVRVLGGCCGTDSRHVSAMWDRHVAPRGVAPA